jgi:hypothetical protein
MWNSTQYPQGPQSQHTEQYYNDSYSGGNFIINGSELCGGLNTEINDYIQGWIYGYFFAPGGWGTADEALKDAVIWLDYNISGSNVHRTMSPPVPKQGHPYHVPIAVPTGGNYNHWMVIRGIHTNRSMWDISIPGDHHLLNGRVAMYGFWLNDPSVGGVGNNLYVTTQRFKDNYFYKLNVPGDFYNNTFLVITDPPRDVQVDTSKTDINTVPTAVMFSGKEALLIQQTYSRVGMKGLLAVNKLVSLAFRQASLVLNNDVVFGSDFVGSHVVKKPVCNEYGEYTVTFAGVVYVYDVLLSQLGGLLQIKITDK